MKNLNIPLTPLCELALKYGSDKCPRIGHCYTPFYYQFLKDKRHSIKKVLEMGVGNHRMTRRNPAYKTAGGLRMWRDFFPNAQIYGADIRADVIFSEERLTTYLCDERKKTDIEHLISLIGSDIDLVIDDASHHVGDQIFLFQTLMPILKKEVIYIVEDCYRTRQMSKTFPQYNSYVPPLLPNENQVHGNLVVFTNK